MSYLIGQFQNLVGWFGSLVDHESGQCLHSVKRSTSQAAVQEEGDACHSLEQSRTSSSVAESRDWIDMVERL